MAVTSTIDDELNQFERDIRQLKIEYDQFFGGGRKRPPTEIEWRIEQIVKRHAERAGELKCGSVSADTTSPRRTRNIRIFSAKRRR